MPTVAKDYTVSLQILFYHDGTDTMPAALMSDSFYSNFYRG